MREGMNKPTEEGMAFGKWVRSNPYTVLLVVVVYISVTILMFKFAE